MSKIMLIGGPGNISTSCVEQLLVRNHEVAVFTLPESPDLGLSGKLRFYRGNRNDTAQIEKAVADFKPDTVADFVCFTPAQAAALVPILQGKLRKFLLVSTCDVYGYPLSRIPLAESDPFTTPVSAYARDKLECEKIFQSAHAQGTLPLAILRPSYSFGPSFVLNVFSRKGGLELISRLRAGRPMVLPGDGQTFIHPGSAYNTGRMAAEIILDTRSVGESFTGCHETYLTHEQYYRLFADALGVEPRFVPIPKDLLLPLEMKLIPDNLLSELSQFHIAFSAEKFKRFYPSFRWEKSLPQAAREYIDFHDRKGDIPPAADSYEDRLISAWEVCRREFKPRS
jgi:nucleoside-diphosphate-sugar epimerase